MNKFSFINQLLKNEKFNPSQKERFLKLVSKELDAAENIDQKMLEDIKLIKEKIGLSNELTELFTDFKGGWGDLEKLEITDAGNNEDDIAEERKRLKLPQLDKETSKVYRQTKPIHKNLPEPNPKHVADFMSLFNKRQGLKYLTHDYDENSEFDIDKYLLSANDIFIRETKKLNIPTSLWRIVKQFAFDSKQTEWSSISVDYRKRITRKIGWATQELRDWSKQNHLHPIRNDEYKKVINDFKRITRIEISNLEKLIDATLESVFENVIGDFEIKKIDLSKADFYSHVEFLKIALETIFDEIKKRSDSPLKKEITIKYERSISDEGYYLRKIVITHHKSFPNKELSVIMKEWSEKGNMGKIYEKLKGYCHWSVETMIDGAATKVNILKEKEIPGYEIIKGKTEESLEGFTHTLTFYYK